MGSPSQVKLVTEPKSGVMIQEVVLVLSPEPTSLVDAYAVVTYREIAGMLAVSEPRGCQLHGEAIGRLRKLMADT